MINTHIISGVKILNSYSNSRPNVKMNLLTPLRLAYLRMESDWLFELI